MNRLVELLESLVAFLKSFFIPAVEMKPPAPAPPKEPVKVEPPQPPPEPEKPKWHEPIHPDKFRITQRFFNPDPETYKKTGHHPGTDYGTQGTDNIPLYYCADGEVIESGINQYFGNYFFYYVQEVDRTFVYFHLRDAAPAKGQHKAGEQCGITGNTGLSFGIHLHLECMKGKQTSVDRSRLYFSADALATAAEDPDPIIRAKLHK